MQKNKAFAPQLLGFNVASILGGNCDLILVLSSQFFEYLRETLYKNALEHLQAARLEKKWVIFFSSYGKCLAIIDLFEGL